MGTASARSAGVMQRKGVPWLTGLLLATLAGWAQAQAIYRIESPDGRVRFSDQPPGPNEKAAPLTREGRVQAAPNNADILPFELRQLVARFPVTLYTGANCSPCDQGRALLNARGIPYTEYTITTPQDVEALQGQHGEPSLPVLTIGGQRVRGFLDAEWSQYLDAAGYPKTSALPAGYRNPAATPLSPPPRPLPASPSDTAATSGPRPPKPPRPAPPRAPAPSPDNPAGIRF